MTTAPPSSKAPRLWRAPALRVSRALCIALLALWSTLFVRDAIARFASIDWSHAGKGDAAVDWAAARLFWQGVSPYSPEGLKAVGVDAFGHPPTTPFWFLPLAELDHPTMGQVLGIVNLGLALGLIAMLVFTLRLPAPALTTALVFGVFQSLPPALEHARVIQISVWIAFAYVLAWRWLRSGHDGRAGLALGAACTLKFFPGILVLYLLVLGRLRAFVAAAAAFLGVAAIVTWRWGFEAWVLFFEQQDVIARRWFDSVRNAALPGILRRAFGPLCAHPEPKWWVSALTALSCLLLLVAALWLARRAHARRDDPDTFDASYALFVALSAFINPWIWEHYFYVLLLPSLIGLRAGALCLVRALGPVRIGAVVRSRVRAARIAVGVAAALGCAAPSALLLLACQHLYGTNAGARGAYCHYSGHTPGVPEWLLERSRHFELVNWLPWPAFVVVFMAILAYRAWHGARSEGTGAQSGVPSTSISPSTISVLRRLSTRSRT